MQRILYLCILSRIVAVPITTAPACMQAALVPLLQGGGAKRRGFAALTTLFRSIDAVISHITPHRCAEPPEKGAQGCRHVCSLRTLLAVPSTFIHKKQERLSPFPLFSKHSRYRKPNHRCNQCRQHIAYLDPFLGQTQNIHAGTDQHHAADSAHLHHH